MSAPMFWGSSLNIKEGNIFDLIPPLIPKGQRAQNDSDFAKSGEALNLKERNKIAARKWRLKKDHYLSELESENEELRAQAIHLSTAFKKMSNENASLESQLEQCRTYVSKAIMRRSTVMN